MATVLDELLVKLGFVTDTKGLTDAQKEARKVGEEAQKAAEKAKRELGSLAKEMATAFAAVSAAVGAAGAAIYKLADESASQAKELSRTAAAIGLTTKEFQELSYAQGQVGKDAKSLEKGLRAFNVFVNEAMTKGTGAMAESLKAMGMSIRDLEGKGTVDLLKTIGKGFQGVESAQQRSALAAKMFEKEYGTDLVNLLMLSGDELDAFRKRAHDMGVVLGEDTISSGEKFYNQMQEIKLGLRNVGIELGTAFMPLVKDVAGQIRDWVLANKDLIAVKVKAFIEGLREAFEDLKPIVEKALEHFEGFLKVAKIIVESMILHKTATAVGLVTTAVLALGRAVATNPLGALITAMAIAIPMAVRLGDALGMGAKEGHSGAVVAPVLTKDREGVLTPMEVNQAKNAINVMTLSSGDTPSGIEAVGRATLELQRLNRIADMRLGRVDQGPEWGGPPEGIDLVPDTPPVEGWTATPEALTAEAKGKGKKKPKKADELAPFMQQAEEMFGGKLDYVMEQNPALPPEARDVIKRRIAQGLQGRMVPQVAAAQGWKHVEALTGREGYARALDWYGMEQSTLEQTLGAGQPPLPLGEITKGSMPQVLISNIYNNFDLDNVFNINGAGDPSKVGQAVVGSFKDLFQQEIERATNTVKSPFRR